MTDLFDGALFSADGKERDISNKGPGPQTQVYTWVDWGDSKDEIGNATLASGRNDKKSCAYSIYNKKTEKTEYYIREADHTGGIFYSPLEQNSMDPIRAKMKSTTTQYHHVSKSAFEMYLRFLRTRNVKFLRHAEQQL